MNLAKLMKQATITVQETAELLGIGKSTVRKMIADGTIDAARFGRRVVVFTAPLRSLLRVGQPPTAPSVTGRTTTALEAIESNTPAPSATTRTLSIGRALHGARGTDAMPPRQHAHGAEQTGHQALSKKPRRRMPSELATFDWS